MRGIDPHNGSHCIADLPDPLEVDKARISGRARADHLRLMFVGEALQFVIVDPLIFLADTIGDDVEPLSGEVDLRTMGQVSTLRQRHRKHGVARFRECLIDRDIGACSRVWLEVGVLCTEELFRTCIADLLCDVDDFAATVIALAGITLGVLVGESRTECSEHRWRCEVLTRDQLEVRPLSLQLLEQDICDLRILASKGIEIRAEEWSRGLGHEPKPRR